MLVDVRIGDRDLGRLGMRVSFDPVREAGTGSYTTLLHHDDRMVAVFEEVDVTGHIATLRRLADGTYTLTIVPPDGEARG
ncbi:MAG TPA: hypothetical protein VF228_23375, partial [Iamia sp.]